MLPHKIVSVPSLRGGISGDPKNRLLWLEEKKRQKIELEETDNERINMKFKSPEGQSLAMGGVFFFVFMAYYIIQGFSGKLYGSTLGSNVELTIYAVFAVFCNIAPAIVNKWGCKLSMAIGILGYASLVAFSLVYFIGNGDEALQPLIILGGALLGVGAALLWTAQGRMILQYSDGENTGHLFSLFWSVFNLSAVAGGFMTFAYFSTSAADVSFKTSNKTTTKNKKCIEWI